jgi:uncharacterized repeat protein (TIGR02543 family)
VPVTSGANQAFTITANTNYHIADVLVDGVSKGAVSNYTFSNVTTGHSIAATFAADIITYTLTITAQNGSVMKSPDKTTYNQGEAVTLTPSPSTGYTFNSWSGDLTDSTSPATITMNANKNITANFVLAYVYYPSGSLKSYTDPATHVIEEYYQNTVIKDESQTPHTLTLLGNTGVDAADYKVTGVSQASTCLDGNGDYVLVPDSDDFNFGTGDFTIDTWVRFSSTSDLQTLYSQNDVGGNLIWFYYYGPSQQIGFRARKNSVYVSSYNTPVLTLSPGSWHHIALVRTGGHIHVYMDGIDTGGTEGAVIGNTDLGNIPAPVRIGYDPYFGGYLNGHIDEFRVSKGIARYTPQTTAYTVDSYTKLLLRESSGAISKRTLSTGTISIYDLSGNLKSG